MNYFCEYLDGNLVSIGKAETFDDFKTLCISPESKYTIVSAGIYQELLTAIDEFTTRDDGRPIVTKMSFKKNKKSPCIVPLSTAETRYKNITGEENIVVEKDSVEEEASKCELYCFNRILIDKEPAKLYKELKPMRLYQTIEDGYYQGFGHTALENIYIQDDDLKCFALEVTERYLNDINGEYTKDLGFSSEDDWQAIF